MKKSFHRYKMGDIVEVIDPMSPYEKLIGEVIKAENRLFRYQVKFGKQLQDTFWYHQIMPHRTKEMLEALIDLSLALGPAAEEMFDDWVMEYKLRFPPESS
jgi:hypothetical protein